MDREAWGVFFVGSTMKHESKSCGFLGKEHSKRREYSIQKAWGSSSTHIHLTGKLELELELKESKRGRVGA